MPSPMNVPEPIASALFGDYLLEMKRFFGNFRSYRKDNSKTILNKKGQKVTNPEYNKQKKIRCIYGTPQAAFRRLFKRTNGKMDLPLINFHLSSWAYDNPKNIVGERLVIPKSYNPDTKTVDTTLPPIHFKLEYTVSLWTSNQIERDDLMYKILRCFRQGELSLIHWPGGQVQEESTEFIFMPIKIQDVITDDTDIEGLDDRETRDLIRTTWLIEGQALVPMDINELNAIETVIYGDSVGGDKNTESVIKYDMSLNDDGNIEIEIDPF